MTIEWIKRESNGRLIMIFGGWSVAAAAYYDVCADGWDVVVCTDFADNETGELNDIISSYGTIYLYAWSLGVSAASRLLPEDAVTVAIAINGTETPRDDRCGIACEIFDATERTLSVPNLERFRRRVFGGRSALEAARHKLGESADIDDLRSQLRWAASACSNKTYWKRVYISRKDLIFPPESQHNAWDSHLASPQIIELDEPHYADLSRIVKDTIPDYKTIGSKFRNSVQTYDLQADAQRLMAAHLSRMVCSVVPRSVGKVLEIGQGSGIFTRMYARLLKPQSITAVDLYDTPKLTCASEIRYVQGDAQQWLEDSRENFDIVVSSSAIQWFTDLSRFFMNVSHRLSPDGVLACSTFLPGNLSELDAVRPSPIIYRSMHELKTLATKWFEDVEVSDQTVVLKFSGAIEALTHLSRTGVGGSGTGAGSVRRLMEKMAKTADGSCTLTYRAAYLLATAPRRSQ